MDTVEREKKRLLLQAKLDRQKTQVERNRLGQFSTPTALAKSILEHSISLLGSDETIRFLDPAFGTGAFFSALLTVAPAEKIIGAQGFEVDPYYANPASEFWKQTSLDLKIADFTQLSPPQNQADRFNLLICNPPYVRHHHIKREQKIRLQALAKATCGIEMNGLAGLYCYFLALSHAWMKQGGISGWLIPSEFMDVNYGKEIKKYLLNNVTIIQIHRFDAEDVQFNDALVSSAIVWIKNIPPSPSHKVKFTFGKSLSSPSLSRSIGVPILKNEAKWTRFPVLNVRKNIYRYCLSDLFEIKRGIATGDNKFFILTREQINTHGIPDRFLCPILPSPRYISSDKIEADKEGLPLLKRQIFLLDCRLPEEVIQTKNPNTWKYIETGIGTVSERYLCRTRKIWYFQEKRLPSPILCTYLGRNTNKSDRIFRFILNLSKAIATNVYLLLYPRQELTHIISQDASQLHKIWEILNTLEPTSMTEEGRIYGGGLHKIEPKELGNVDATPIIDSVPAICKPKKAIQYSLFD